jgi:hypothetical protein
MWKKLSGKRGKIKGDTNERGGIMGKRYTKG